MLENFNYKNFYLIALLILISFVINFYVGSIGVFPVDTFIHYDSGYRILLGDHPVKDYWIVHGFLTDYLQAFFFLLCECEEELEDILEEDVVSPKIKCMLLHLKEMSRSDVCCEPYENMDLLIITRTTPQGH